MAKGLALVVFIVYLIIGLYMINLTLNLISIPETATSFQNIINVIAGIAVILGGLNYLRAGWNSAKLKQYRYGYA